MNSTELVIKTIQESSYTIQQWADELGVHRNQIHRWLSGSVDKIRKDNIFAVGKVINRKPKFSESGVEWVELDNEQLETFEFIYSLTEETPTEIETENEPETHDKEEDDETS